MPVPPSSYLQQLLNLSIFLLQKSGVYANRKKLAYTPDEKFNLITYVSYHIYYKKSTKKSLIRNQIPVSQYKVISLATGVLLAVSTLHKFGKSGIIKITQSPDTIGVAIEVPLFLV